jgi:hypothetical protein
VNEATVVLWTVLFVLCTAGVLLVSCALAMICLWWIVPKIDSRLVSRPALPGKTGRSPKRSAGEQPSNSSTS